MATSGTYTFSVTRNDIIGASLRLLEVYGAGETIQADDITNCSQALNILVKEMVISGMPLWTVNEITVGMTSGVSQYSIGLASSQPRPLKILQAFIRDANNQDTMLEVLSRYDFNTLGYKEESGIPNQLYYDPQIGSGIITLFNVPSDSTSTIHLVIQRQIQDFSTASNTPDLPQEAYRMLKWCLAEEIALEYGAKEKSIALIAMKAKQLRDDFMSFEQETASVYFAPNVRS